MNRALTFDDVLIVPKYSTVQSRQDVSLQTDLGSGLVFNLPVISSNMDTITDHKMALAMDVAGGGGCLHRFNSIEMSCHQKKLSASKTIVSFGLGDYERKRVSQMYNEGALYFCLDVAHGAQKQIIEQMVIIKEQHPSAWIMVGNFASVNSVAEFLHHIGEYKPDVIKVGIGPGSACTTRIKTGVGYPQFSAVQEISNYLKGSGIKVVADGGLRSPGDIAKALGAGAHAVMLGGMLAGTDETPGRVIYGKYDEPMKEYRGSASKESYEKQGKDDSWRAAEGMAFAVPIKGPVAPILQDIEGGLRSALTYVGARNLEEFRDKIEFVNVTSAAVTEGKAHGNNEDSTNF